MLHNYFDSQLEHASSMFTLFLNENTLKMFFSIFYLTKSKYEQHQSNK